MKYGFIYDTDIGKLVITEDGKGIDGVIFDENNISKEYSIRETELLKKAISQIKEYLTGKRQEFDLPISINRGTEFQRKVWNVLTKIPYGETRSYKDIAEMVNSPKAYRAVGTANNKNPIYIIIPCHRVIGSDGKLVGYGGGIHIKEKLLDLENRYK